MLSTLLSMVSDESDKEFIRSLYEANEQLMYRVADKILHNRHDAEDAVHDAFVRVIKNISKFRKYSCKENISYLVIIVRGIALNMLSYSGRLAELDDEIPAHNSTEDAALTRIEYNEIVANINRLSPAMRDIAVLYFAEGCSAA